MSPNNLRLKPTWDRPRPLLEGYHSLVGHPELDPFHKQTKWSPHHPITHLLTQSPAPVLEAWLTWLGRFWLEFLEPLHCFSTTTNLPSTTDLILLCTLLPLISLIGTRPLSPLPPPSFPVRSTAIAPVLADHTPGKESYTKIPPRLFQRRRNCFSTPLRNLFAATQPPSFHYNFLHSHSIATIDFEIPNSLYFVCLD
jgi:hypothetical protein